MCRASFAISATTLRCWGGQWIICLADGSTHIVLVDEDDGANGWAQVLPHRIIRLNAVAPDEVGEISHFDDWLSVLVTHELAHIVHLDTVLGGPRAVNEVFGRLMAPNGVQPRWLTEGVATYFESTLTGSGRLRSSYSCQLKLAPRHWTDSH